MAAPEPQVGEQDRKGVGCRRNHAHVGRTQLVEGRAGRVRKKLRGVYFCISLYRTRVVRGCVMV